VKLRKLEKILSEELYNLYSSPSIISVMKSRRMRWVGHVARMEEMRNVYCVLVGNPEEKDNLEGTGVDERIILKWILKKYDGRVWTGFIWLRIRAGSGLL
jgi:hypothetical protein